MKRLAEGQGPSIGIQQHQHPQLAPEKKVTFILPPKRIKTQPSTSSNSGTSIHTNYTSNMTDYSSNGSGVSPMDIDQCSSGAPSPSSVPTPTSSYKAAHQHQFTFDVMGGSTPTPKAHQSLLRKQSSLSSTPNRKSYSPSPFSTSPIKSSHRLDARYSSRLPHHMCTTASPRNASFPLYAHQHNQIDQSIDSNEDIKKNLFQATTQYDGGNNTTTMLDTSLEFGIKLNSTPRRMHDTTAAKSPTVFVSSPTSSIRSMGSQRTGYSSDGSSVSSFFNSSPRKRGVITGVSSPMSGNLSNPIVSTSSMASSLKYDNGRVGMADEGAGDRFIPSRISSNLSFSLPVVSPTFGACRQYADGGSESSGNSQVGSSDATERAGTAAGGARVTTATTGAGTRDAAATTLDDEDPFDTSSERRHDASSAQPRLYDALLRSEMLGENFDSTAHSTVMSKTSNSPSKNEPRQRDNNLKFVSPRQAHINGLFRHQPRENRPASVVNSYNISPISSAFNQKSTLGSYDEQRMRKIAKVPFKVLDAPAIQDDYYLNLGKSQTVAPYRIATSLSRVTHPSVVFFYCIQSIGHARTCWL